MIFRFLHNVHCIYSMDVQCSLHVIHLRKKLLCMMPLVCEYLSMGIFQLLNIIVLM